MNMLASSHRNDLDCRKKHQSLSIPSGGPDPTPFKEHYRCIPPGMYEEVKMHIQKMLDVGAIIPSSCPWASAVVLV